MNWEKISDGAVREIHRQGEEVLKGTVQLALAADQRATTLCGIFGGGAVALLAAAATILAGSNLSAPSLIAALVTALLLFVASLFCASAARPTAFFVGGYEPRFLISSGTDEMWMLRYASDDLQDRIDANRKALDHAASLVQWGMRFAGSAIVAGIAAFLIARWAPACLPW